MAMAGISPMETGLSSTAIMEMGAMSAKSSTSSKMELMRNVRRRHACCAAWARTWLRFSARRMLPRITMSRR